MDEAVRVAVVEDAGLLRALLVETLHQTPGIRVVGSHGTCAEALADIPGRQPDAVLLDLRMPDGDGLHLGLALQARLPRLRVIVVSDLADASLLMAVPVDRRSAWSYLLKGSLGSSAELGTAVRRAVREGRTHVDPGLTASASAHAWATSLSSRQRDILDRLAEGASNAAISAALSIAPGTVEYHLTALYQLMGIPSDVSVNARVLAARAWSDVRQATVVSGA